MELVIIRGLPGSGKTTMAKVLALVGYEHYEADQFFEKSGHYQFDKSKLPAAHMWCYYKIKDAISRGQRCVVSNTFTQLWEAKPYIDVAKDSGFNVKIISAIGNWNSCHDVPEAVIINMRKRWEEF